VRSNPRAREYIGSIGWSRKKKDRRPDAHPALVPVSNSRAKSPYTLSYGEQVKICLRRGFWRLKADPSLTLSQLFGNIAMGLIVSSVFYNLPMVSGELHRDWRYFALIDALVTLSFNQNTSSFYSRGALLFFAILLNAFGSALEVSRAARSPFELSISLTCMANPSDLDALRSTTHRRKARTICLLPSVSRGRRFDAHRHAVQNRQRHLLQLDHRGSRRLVPFPASAAC
jgi:hypothetical protein